LTAVVFLLVVTPAQAHPMGVNIGTLPTPKVKHHKKHKKHVVHTEPAPSTPSWFRNAMACISTHEEYGVDGHNTVAGYFGFIYSPASYVEPGPSLAARYGNSWMDIPLEGQYEVAYALEQKYGWSPWSTAGMCGLT
jgi:hypothetical protein